MINLQVFKRENIAKRQLGQGGQYACIWVTGDIPRGDPVFPRQDRRSPFSWVKLQIHHFLSLNYLNLNVKWKKKISIYKKHFAFGIVWKILGPHSGTWFFTGV